MPCTAGLMQHPSSATSQNRSFIGALRKVSVQSPVIMVIVSIISSSSSATVLDGSLMNFFPFPRRVQHSAHSDSMECLSLLSGLMQFNRISSLLHRNGLRVVHPFVPQSAHSVPPEIQCRARSAFSQHRSVGGGGGPYFGSSVSNQSGGLFNIDGLLSGGPGGADSEVTRFAAYKRTSKHIREEEHGRF
ncbi:hypothetical protein NQ317_000239 [Molorchus minor]|uniref:Uncharacterized protein n=1 Tax=Molorchus minor TaxID=1323400 RepID=A0ABQ9JTY6_9CUCU|nr:hypothetical protein NQ317_000239 [Molorchus minor]